MSLLLVTLRRMSIFLFLGVLLQSGQGQSDGPTCITICNLQYQATVRRCEQVRAQNRRADYYADCIKNAALFRRSCLSRCTLPR